MTSTHGHAGFTIGQIIHHRLFDYRGVIFDVDPVFQGDEEWYQNVARTRPPRDRPWYHVLVDGDYRITYVAERNLESDDSGNPVHHPALNEFFTAFDNGSYVSRKRNN